MVNGHPTGVEHFSTNATIALWVGGGLAFIGLVILIFGIVYLLAGGYDTEDIAWTAIVIGGIWSFIVFLGFGIGMWPWDSAHHTYVEYNGSVVQTNSRLLSNGNSGTDQKFAIQLAGSNQVYGCADTRCSLVQPGDVVTLACIQVYQLNATDGLDCNFVSSTKGSE